jgi:hypothetical protein
MHVYMVIASRVGTRDARALFLGSFKRESDAAAAVLGVRADASLDSVWHVSYAPVIAHMPYGGPASARFVLLQAEEWVTLLQKTHADEDDGRPVANPEGDDDLPDLVSESDSDGEGRQEEPREEPHGLASGAARE